MGKILKPLLLLLLCISITTPFSLRVAASQLLEIVIIDVGQGDSTLIITPEGKAVLIDAGDSDHVAKVVEELEARNIDTLEIVIATHPHTEHMQGLIDILKRYQVNEILEPGKEIFNGVYNAFIDMARLKGGSK